MTGPYHAFLRKCIEKEDFFIFLLKIVKIYQKKHQKSLSGGWFTQRYKKFYMQVSLVYKEYKDFIYEIHVVTAIYDWGRRAPILWYTALDRLFMSSILSVL